MNETKGTTTKDILKGSFLFAISSYLLLHDFPQTLFELATLVEIWKGILTNEPCDEVSEEKWKSFSGIDSH